MKATDGDTKKVTTNGEKKRKLTAAFWSNARKGANFINSLALQRLKTKSLCTKKTRKLMATF